MGLFTVPFHAQEEMLLLGMAWRNTQAVRVVLENVCLMSLALLS